ncbi:EAL domain-containing protein [Salinarimonas sp.]|uniref:EAL domain-containing protein n=1 Tax=Salinarimonas sp. TaxID=2766526 RepID=UPI0032D8F8D7
MASSASLYRESRTGLEGNPPRDSIRKRSALEEAGLPAARLELEVTESVLVDDDKRAIAILKALERLGVRIALDDFGTGYSSLSYLTRFPFDAIKIDRSFIRAMSEDESAWHIVQSVLRLSEGLGVRVVAEGVETPGQLLRLLARGCDEVQGYLIARPAPLDALLRATPDGLLALLRDPGAAAADLGVVLEAAAERMKRGEREGERRAG